MFGFQCFHHFKLAAPVTTEGAEKPRPKVNTEMHLHLGQILYNLVRSNNRVQGTKLRMENHTQRSSQITQPRFLSRKHCIF